MDEAEPLTSRLKDGVASFRRHFDRSPTHAAAAPGRVNLIGEHTDYNAGFVLPMAIERQTLLVAHPREDYQARLVSGLEDAPAEFDVDRSLSAGEPAWANYVRGVVAGFLERGLDPGGFEAVVDSNVPLGGGLSSSAALEMATATLLESLAGQTLGGKEKALLCQWAEHTFAGMPCGIMDQFVSAMGEAGSALLIDCRSHETEPVPLDDPAITVLIVNSNVKHALVSGEYAKRREQCETAAQALSVSALRDADEQMLENARERLADAAFRRARHVVGENTRTLAAAEACRQRDWAALGRLMHQSHVSLRDDFEVSCRELDLLVKLAGDQPGVYGARMTGGGFGGCIVCLVAADKADEVAEAVGDQYRQETGIEPATFVTRPAAGARVLEL
jgi:galactokinase